MSLEQKVNIRMAQSDKRIAALQSEILSISKITRRLLKENGPVLLAAKTNNHLVAQTFEVNDAKTSEAVIDLINTTNAKLEEKIMSQLSVMDQAIFSLRASLMDQGDLRDDIDGNRVRTTILSFLFVMLIETPTSNPPNEIHNKALDNVSLYIDTLSTSEDPYSSDDKKQELLIDDDTEQFISTVRELIKTLRDPNRSKVGAGTLVSALGQILRAKPAVSDSTFTPVSKSD
jgi:hypothetical protein